MTLYSDTKTESDSMWFGVGDGKKFLLFVAVIVVVVDVVVGLLSATIHYYPFGIPMRTVSYAEKNWQRSKALETHTWGIENPLCLRKPIIFEIEELI